ncbi:hypothetical protein CMALT430_310048 [Carnobacterium maltaromaticum]|nr:hypothetical protein CMALT430_310048 [Carnobacterium maltaromaticum]
MKAPTKSNGQFGYTQFGYTQFCVTNKKSPRDKCALEQKPIVLPRNNSTRVS